MVLATVLVLYGKEALTQPRKPASHFAVLWKQARITCFDHLVILAKALDEKECQRGRASGSLHLRHAEPVVKHGGTMTCGVCGCFCDSGWSASQSTWVISEQWPHCGQLSMTVHRNSTACQTVAPKGNLGLWIQIAFEMQGLSNGSLRSVDKPERPSQISAGALERDGG